MTFAALLARWPDIENDLQDVGVNVGDQQLMRSMTWRWLRCRIEGLLTRPISYAANGEPLFTSRLQEHVFQPAVEQARAARATK